MEVVNSMGLKDYFFFPFVLLSLYFRCRKLNTLRQTVGLGQCTTIKRLEVFWPTTGGTQVFTDVPMNGFIRIVEGEDRYTLRSLKTYGLGRPAF